MIQRWLKKPWPYWVGGILTGLLNVLLLALTGLAWMATGGYLLWSTGTLDLMGFKPFEWEYFSIYRDRYAEIISGHSIWVNPYTLLNIGVILGSAVATLLASQFKLGKIRGLKQVFFAFAGGLLMGYGSRLAGGCNIGAFLSGIPSFSLHAWVFWLFVTAGAWVGAKIILRYLA
ncbi:MAG: YeeE/YedE thiosulfate transporter family protein [Oscillospiraceae bacterium]|nr:YeeE/YedE thiosulfate transporter family protein [Oscillospiraceae bacterium]